MALCKIYKYVKKLFLKCCYAGYTPAPKSKLYLELVGSGKSVLVFIHEIEAPPANFRTENFSVKYIEVKMNCFSRIYVDWGTSRCYIHPDPKSINLPAVVGVDFCKARHLSHILSRNSLVVFSRHKVLP